MFLWRKRREAVSLRREMEPCVSCGGMTSIPKALPVQLRYGYVEGAGQLCPGCYGLLSKGAFFGEEEMR